MLLTANRRLDIPVLVVYMLLLIASGVLINFVGGPSLRHALPNPYVLALMVLSLLCLGSWVCMFKLAGKWRFELFYFDFAFGLFVAVPAVWAYNWFTNKVEAFGIEMTNSSSELIDYFIKQHGARK